MPEYTKKMPDDEDRIAVFYRVNFMQRALERALRLTSIPYQIVAGTEFYQRREIKDLVAYLRILRNPRNDFSLLRILNQPPRGIGKATLAYRFARFLFDQGADGGGGLFGDAPPEAAPASRRDRGRQGSRPRPM